jgi:mediator of RNA polymerase II transcription subunit 13
MLGLLQWSKKCENWLQVRGLATEEELNGPWLAVELPISDLPLAILTQKGKTAGQTEQKLVMVPWPQALCLSQVSHKATHDKSVSWPVDYDVLGFAEDWYTGQAERDETAALRQKERKAKEASAQADSAYDVQHPLLTNISTDGNAYLTPPDVPHLNTAVTPPFDEDGMASPEKLVRDELPQNGHEVSSENSSDEVHSVENGATVTDTSVKEGNAQATNVDYEEAGTGNLFGDLGDDLFGEDNGITDADFSFFDEPDELPDVMQDIFQGNPSEEKVEQDGPQDSHPTDSHLQDETESLSIMTREGLEKLDIAEDDEPVDQAISQGPIISGDPMELDDTAMDIVSAHDVQQSESPLLPNTIFEQLSGAWDASGREHQTKYLPMELLDGTSNATFDQLSLDRTFAALNDKYGEQGPYRYPAEKQISFHAAVHGPRKNSTMQSYWGAPLKHGLPETPASLYEVMRLPSPASDLISDSDETRPQSPDLDMDSHKRKRDIDDEDGASDRGNNHSSVATGAAPDGEDVEDSESDTTDYLDTLEPFAFDADAASWSLANYLQWPESKSNSPILADSDYITLAQLLTSQAVSSTFCAEPISQDAESFREEADESYSPRFIHDDLKEAVQARFSGVEPCTFSSFLDIRGLPRPGQLPNRLAARPFLNNRSEGSGEPPQPSTVFSLSKTSLEVSRADSKLSVLPAAVHFWDVLGLGPRNGPKNIASLCVFASAPGMAEAAENFLDDLKSAYESRRFGQHSKLVHDFGSPGIYTLQFDGHDPPAFAAYQGATVYKNVGVSLGQTIAGCIVDQGLDETNLVIYYVYDPVRESIPQLCLMFHTIYESCKAKMSKDTIAVDIVFQLVPMHMVASPTKFSVPSPGSLEHLALEVYDRCIDFASGTAAPAIAIEPQIPRVIDFKLSMSPSSSLLQDSATLHIAYAQSIDGRWITVAWTDNIGNNTTTSYCLGRKGSPPTTEFAEIAQEIWQTTLETTAAKKVHWRIILAKTGVMEPSEKHTWVELTNCDASAHISLTLLTVKSDPQLQLLGPELSIPPALLSSSTSFYSTPVSTPQPSSVLSPEANASTPHPSATTPTADSGAAEPKIDMDAKLIDICDQTFGAILSHRTNNSNSLLELRPAIVSGYLIKRTGPSASDVPALMEVNIIWTDANPRLVENLFREILGWYKNLATLSRARGVTGMADARPWHVAAVEKAIRALYALM